MGAIPVAKSAVSKHRIGLNDINKKYRLNESETHSRELQICYASEHF